MYTPLDAVTVFPVMVTNVEFGIKVATDVLSPVYICPIVSSIKIRKLNGVPETMFGNVVL